MALLGLRGHQDLKATRAQPALWALRAPRAVCAAALLGRRGALGLMDRLGHRARKDRSEHEDQLGLTLTVRSWVMR